MRTRRQKDQFQSLIQNVLLAVTAGGIIYGQAEMLGEPSRHYLAVGGTIAMIFVAIWMKVT